jgi:tRNA/rRNA methyltransferase
LITPVLNQAQRDRLDIVLVSPRNPLNIGAVARAMANFGFAHLTVVAPYAPSWREAKSAVGAPDVLTNARETATLAEAVAHCTFVAATGTLTYRKPEQEVLQLPALAPRMQQVLESGGLAGLIFGSEKHGLTRDDLAFCHALVEIPTDPRQPSMNLGQAAAVCLYELARLEVIPSSNPPFRRETGERMGHPDPNPADSVALDRLASLIEETMAAAQYSPAAMRPANQHDLRLLLRRLHFSALDTRRALGLFRRILWRLRRGQPGASRD